MPKVVNTSKVSASVDHLNQIVGFQREADLTISYVVKSVSGERVRDVQQSELLDKYQITERQRARYMNKTKAYNIVRWSKRSHQMTLKWLPSNNTERDIVVMDDELNLRAYGITQQQRSWFIKTQDIVDHMHAVTEYNSWDGCHEIAMLQINNKLKSIKADSH